MSLEAAYLAGVVDSDGCIRVEMLRNHGRSHDGVSYAPIVTIQQVECEAVKLARDLFGGHVLCIKGKVGRPMQRWTAKSRVATAALHRMLPFLRIKKEQATNAIALHALVIELNRLRYAGVVPGKNGPRRRTHAELAMLHEHFLRSRELNGGLPTHVAIQQRRMRGLTPGLPLAAGTA